MYWGLSLVRTSTIQTSLKNEAERKGAMKRQALVAFLVFSGAFSACNCGSDPYAEGGNGEGPSGPSHYDANVPNNPILGNDAGGGGQTGSECQEGYTECLSETLVAFCLDGKVSGANCAASGLVCATTSGHSACTEPGVVIPDQDAGQTVIDAGTMVCNETTPKFCVGTMLSWCSPSGFQTGMDCAVFGRICGLDSQGLMNCIERPVAGSDAGQTGRDAGNSNQNGDAGGQMVNDAGQSILDAGNQACNQNTPSTCTGSVLNWCSQAGFRYALDCNLFNQVCGLGAQGTMTCIDRPAVGNDAGQTVNDAGQQSGTDAGTQQCNPNMAPTCTQGILHWCDASGTMSQFNCVQAGLMCGLSEIGAPGCVTVPSAVDAGGNPSILNDGGLNSFDASSNQTPVDGGVPSIFTDGGTTSLDAGVVGMLDSGVPPGYASSVTCENISGDQYHLACTLRGVMNLGAWETGFSGNPVRIVIGSVRADGTEPVCRTVQGVGYECQSKGFFLTQTEYRIEVPIGKLFEIGIMTDATYASGGVNENRAVYRPLVVSWLAMTRTQLSGRVYFDTFEGRAMFHAGDQPPAPDGGITPTTPDAGFVPGSPTYVVECLAKDGDIYHRSCTISGVMNGGVWERQFSGNPVRIVSGTVRIDGSEPRCMMGAAGVRFGCDSKNYNGAWISYAFDVGVGKILRFGVTTSAVYAPGGAKENAEVDPLDVATFNDVYHADIRGHLEVKVFDGQYELFVN